MKWSRDHGLTCGLKRENGKVFGVDQTFNVTKVQAVFSCFDLCDLEKPEKTDTCNTCDVTLLDTQSESFVTLAIIITSEMVLLHLTNAPWWPYLESDRTQIWCRHIEDLDTSSRQITVLQVQ